MAKNYILTPKPGKLPRINGSKVFGVRPGNPFLYKVAATGEKPLKFTAEHLPGGLVLDEASGIITGRIATKGTYHVKISVSNSIGVTDREFRIEVGDTICLTPPMGWNSWYVHSLWVSQEKIEGIAKAMVDKGLVDHGWTYVNIDDCWQGQRDMEKTKALQPNAKFPDMKKMCDNIHELGLKVGIYSTPWAGSYAGYIGGSIPNDEADYTEWTVDESVRKEKFQLFGDERKTRKKPRFFGTDMSDYDAKQWAEWGFDYLKYDWNPNDIEHITIMRDALMKSGRDFVYSLSNSAPFAIVDEIKELANVWRTSGDIIDYWIRVAQIGFSQGKWSKYGGPGHWNDPDMLQLGMTAHPHKAAEKYFPTHLKPDEQYSQMSLWCLLCAPLLLSCNIEDMDDFTLNLLTNDEVIEVNQDPLGEPAKLLQRNRFTRTEYWGKTMEDGCKVVGLFNRSLISKRISFKMADLNLSGQQIVRDLWRQKDLGTFSQKFSATVPPHGVKLVRIIPK